VEYTKKTVTTSKMSEAKDQIAIIYAQGEIQGGEGDVNNQEGSMRRSLQEARKIKCKRNCIDSPGSAFNL
jgi:protease-4